MRSDRFGRDAQIPLYVNDLLLYLNRLVYERLHPQKSRTEESLYQNVAAYIEEHLDEDLSLEKLAGEFLSANTTLPMYSRIIWDCRFTSTLQKTACPLQEAILGQMSITEAYQTFGFGDYSSFYRAFKKNTGFLPKISETCKRSARVISLNGRLHGDLYTPGCCPGSSP